MSALHEEARSASSRDLAVAIYAAADDLTIAELNERLDAAGLTWKAVCQIANKGHRGTLPGEEICRRCRRVPPCDRCEELHEGRYRR